MRPLCRSRVATLALLAIGLLVFAAHAAGQDNDTTENKTDDGNVTGEESDRRLPTPVLVAGALVALLVGVGVLLLARTPKPPAP